MGLYDDRLATLSESRGNRVSQRRPIPSPREASTTDVQSLLFARGEGWTESSARAWAKSHGYKHGKVHVTDQYIRIRQFDPKGFKVKRTVPFGRGIRAVVAREGVSSMTTKEAKRRHRRRPAKKAPARKHRRRRARAVAAPKRRRRRPVAAAPRRRRRRVAAVAAPRRRRRRAAPMVMEAPRKRRKARRKPRRVRASTTVRAWRGNRAGHAKAARKGWRKRRRSHSVRTPSVVMAPRRRRRRVHAVAAPRRRRAYSARAVSRGGSSLGCLAVGGLAAVTTFVVADAVDRLLATYNPKGTETPKDKFTSNGTGTLANTLNAASAPGWARAGASVGLIAVPAVASRFVRNPYGRSALEGSAIGALVNGGKLLWNTVIMPMLIGKDTSVAALQGSYIARLYPAEVAATINRKQKQTAVSSTGSGALSEGQAGVGDVGPFATGVGADSPYPNAAEALRAGVSETFPTVQNQMGTGGPGSDYSTAAQAMGTGWAPGPPAGPGPGPQVGRGGDSAECSSCLSGADLSAPFLGTPESDPLPYQQ